MHIIEYETKYRDDTIALMAELQDFERTLCTDRTPGASMAADHFDFLLDFSRANAGKIYLALSGSQVVGFVVVFLEKEDEGDIHLVPEYRRYGWVSDLIVKQDHRGSRAASLLMEYAEQHCVSLGVRRIKVGTLHNNERARHFYKKAGYSVYEVIYSKAI